MINWHKRYIEYWKKKLNVSDYGVAWVSVQFCSEVTYHDQKSKQQERAKEFRAVPEIF